MKKNSFWNEEWEPIQFDGLKKDERYMVSNYGRIMHYKQNKQQWKLLKTANTNGYQYFTWFKSEDGKRERISKPVHRLVAYAYCEKPSERHKYVIHLDYNKSNNYYKNLKWATQKELTVHNQQNPAVQAAREKRKGEITNAKLTEADVIRLKKKLKRGKNPLYKIAREFGITHTQLNRIRSGENWGHVKID